MYLAVVTTLIGLQPLAVLSGSMRPVYPMGSLIYLRSIEPTALGVGDVVTYEIDQDTMVPHRIVAKDAINRTFQAKGDANDTVDGGAVSYSQIIGTPLFHIPLLGYLAVYANTREGIILTIMVAAILLLLNFLPNIFIDDDKKEGMENGKSS